jgi:segregation and condensation protein B
LAEAHLFASAEPVSAAALAAAVGWDVDLRLLMDALAARHAGRGFELAAVGEGWQFRTAPDLANQLRPIHGRERRLPRAAMETLVLIAYQQPVTRPELEDLLGHAVSQPSLDVLLEAGLIRSLGRKDVAGRPMLWGTTPHFLAHFALNGLGDLPGFGVPLTVAVVDKP